MVQPRTMAKLSYPPPPQGAWYELLRVSDTVQQGQISQYRSFIFFDW